MDDYGVRSKLAFDIGYGGYKNQQQNIHFIHKMPITQEVVEISEVVLLLRRLKKRIASQKKEKQRASVILLLKLH